ncbi:Regulator of sigma-E protease RseP [Andreprevotia sp. IGB-42]|uniref:RIP metalloprotease RseP n=1 Tax=Andreprevotia sp. IGB-42 TaxID=2497473 RepID=UPI00135AA0D5|nr:RIP metalloprotease RseP [Andreprevotia sp. IGB-42]KAF0814375.1 Regulator of sigma-E protease RseP [Andreprevotia sp. IGB-42]
MHILITIAAFIVTLGILVTIHEYGHYWVARRCGIKVLTFSVGFGKPLLTWQRGDTQWQIAMIPLGGYVKMLDEREAPVSDAERSVAFNNQHPLKKMGVVAAGPLANLLLAIVLTAGVYAYGVQTIKPVLGLVSADSVAARAGLQAGNEVLTVDGEPVSSWDAFFLEMLGTIGQDTAMLEVASGSGARRVVTLPLDSLGKSAFGPGMLGLLGMSPYPLTLTVGDIAPGQPADRAGLKVGDRLLALDGKPLSDWTQIPRALAAGQGKKVDLLVARQSQQFTLHVQPTLVTQGDVRIGKIGVGPAVDEARWQAQRFTEQYGAVDAIGVAVHKLWAQTRITFLAFGHMFTGRAPLDQISGPLTIAKFAGDSASLGLVAFIQFLSVISLSLAVLNLLPVPVLDGGHLMYHTAELLTGRPVPARIEEIGQRVGLALLLGLMALALFNDFHRFLPG